MIRLTLTLPSLTAMICAAMLTGASIGALARLRHEQATPYQQPVIAQPTPRPVIWTTPVVDHFTI